MTKKKGNEKKWEKLGKDRIWRDLMGYEKRVLPTMLQVLKLKKLFLKTAFLSGLFLTLMDFKTLTKTLMKL